MQNFNNQQGGQFPNQNPNQNFNNQQQGQSILGEGYVKHEASSGIMISQSMGDKNCLQVGEQFFGRVVNCKFLNVVDRNTKRIVYDDSTGLPKRKAILVFTMEQSTHGRPVGQDHAINLTGMKLEVLEAMGIGVGDQWGVQVKSHDGNHKGKYYVFDQMCNRITESTPFSDPQNAQTQTQQGQTQNEQYPSNNSDAGNSQQFPPQNSQFPQGNPPQNNGNPFDQINNGQGQGQGQNQFPPNNGQGQGQNQFPPNNGQGQGQNQFPPNNGQGGFPQ